ncbi:MAG: hypothetical protein RLZZ219_1221 [Cyanobacteriota bacterium]|jgi:hypothetical protein
MRFRTALLVLVAFAAAIAAMPAWIPELARGWNRIGDWITTPEHRAWSRCRAEADRLLAQRLLGSGAAAGSQSPVSAGDTCGVEPPPFAWSGR